MFQTLSPGSVEAEKFVSLMRRLEKACCVQVLTYALMANHFHILCKVPERRLLSDRELLDCIEFGYGPERRAQVAEQLGRLQQGGPKPYIDFRIFGRRSKAAKRISIPEYSIGEIRRFFCPKSFSDGAFLPPSCVRDRTGRTSR